MMGAKPVLASSTTMCEPRKPAPPVTRTVSGMVECYTVCRARPGAESTAQKSRARDPAVLQRTKLSGCLRLFVGCLGTIDEFDQRHRCGIALAVAQLQHAQAAGRARLEARTELVEELGHDLAITEAIERQPAVRE